MRYSKRIFIMMMLPFWIASCGQSNDIPTPETSDAAQSPEHQQSAPKGLPAQSEPPAAAQTETSTALLAIYQTLNMRSFPSSFGPRLKFHCESYPFEYFPQEGVQIDSATRMTLVNGDDTWIIELIDKNRIKLDTRISGPGSYHAVAEYELQTIGATGDLRADAQWIEQKADCAPLNKNKPTRMGLVDVRKAQATGSWTCGDYWGGNSSTPELVYWKTLAKLPHERDPSRNNWGAADMLRIGVTAHAAMSDVCARGEQVREVRVSAVYAQPGGTKTGKFVRIWTYRGGLLDMAGFITLDKHGSHKVNFDTIAKEQVVLVINAKDQDWVDISTVDGTAAWINQNDFEPHVFTTAYLPYLERLMSADELKLVDSTPRLVHSNASDETPVVYTLGDVGTAMHPMAISNDWMKVRFVAPPEYPAIGCGDEESNFDWITGWIRWRDGDDWYVTEEHHYGC